MFEVKTILAPIDFSLASQAAFDTAKVIAAKFAAKLVTMSVIPPPKVYWDAGPDFSVTDGNLQRNSATERLAKFNREDGGEIERVVRVGDAKLLIVHEADDRHCDLIVMGTAGRSGIGRLLLGSVAEYVSRRAPCPVLLIKAPPEEVSPQLHSESSQTVHA